MASNWPTGVDSFSDPSPSTAMNNATQPHSAMHALANDAIHAMQSGAGAANGLATLGSATVRTVGGSNRPSLSVDTAANWAANNPVLGASEVAVESDTGVVKHGDGATVYASLNPILSSTYVPRASGNSSTPAPLPFFNVKDYGAVGNAVINTDGAMTAGSAVLTSASGLLVGIHVGDYVAVFGAGSAGATLVSTVASVQSATQVTLAASAVTAVSGAEYVAGHDDTTAIQNAVNAAGGGVNGSLGGVAVLPPGQYLITQPIVWVTSQGNNVGVAGPSLIALNASGRIGDNNDASSAQLVCAPYPTFPSGQYAVDWRSGTSTTAGPINGSVLAGFGISCLSVAAGLRLSGGRRCRIENVNVDHGGTPSPTVVYNNDTGAITVERNGNNNAAAFNIVENCSVNVAAKNAIVIDDNGVSRVSKSFVIAASNYSFYLGDGAAGSDLHTEESGVADVYMSSRNTLLDGMDFFGGTSFGPKQSNLIIAGNGTAALPGSARISNCTFLGNVTTALSSQAGAMVQLVTGSGTVNAVLNNCSFHSQSGNTAFFWAQTGLTGSVYVDNCDFEGSPSGGFSVLNGFAGLYTGLTAFGVHAQSSGTVRIMTAVGSQIQLGSATGTYVSFADNGSGGVDVNGAGALRLYAANPPIVARVPLQLLTGGSLTSGSGAPTTPGSYNPVAGDVYFRTDTPTVANQRIYICTVGGATPTWVGIV